MIATAFNTATGDSNGLLERTSAILILECYALDISLLDLLNEQAIGYIHSIRISGTALSKKHKEVIGNNCYNHKNDCTEKQIATIGPPSASGIVAVASIIGALWAAWPSWI